MSTTKEVKFRSARSKLSAACKAERDARQERILCEADYWEAFKLIGVTEPDDIISEIESAI